MADGQWWRAMKLGKAIAILIWVLAGAAWLSGLISMLKSPVPQLPSMPAAAAPILIIPFVFFAAVAVLQPRPSPNTMPPSSSLFADIERNLNLQPLFGVACIMFGILEFIQAIRADAVIDAYVSYGFFFSGGLGILTGHIILAKRGMSEFDSPSHQQANRNFLPASIRRLRATNLTAFLAGIWTVLGMACTSVLLLFLEQTPLIGFSLFSAAAIVFFLIPALIFVVGIQNRDLRQTNMFSITRLKWQGSVGVRMWMWFLGAAFLGFAFQAVPTLYQFIAE